MKEINNIARKAGIIFFGKIVGQSLDLATILIITRLIKTDIYGSFLYVLALVNIITVFSNMGMTNGLLAFIPKYIVDKDFKKRNSIITFSLLLGIFLSLIGIIGIYLLIDAVSQIFLKNNPLYIKTLLILAPFAVISTMNSIMQHALRGLGGVRYFVISTEGIMPIVRIISVIIMSFFVSKINVLVLSLYISSIVTGGYLFSGMLKYKLLAPINIQYISEYKQFMKFSFHLMMSKAMGTIISQIDTVMIGYYLQPEAVAIYRIVSKLSTVTAMILSAFNIAYAPKISELFHRKNISEIESLNKTITRWTTIFGLLIFGFIVLDSKLILETIFGAEYAAGSMVLIIISFGQLINAATGCVDTIYIMTGHSKQYFYSQVFNTVLKIGLNFILIPSLGINGVAFAAMICLSAVNILRIFLVYHELKIHPFGKELIKPGMSMAISIFLIFYIQCFTLFGGILKLIIEGVIYIAVFTAVIFILGLPKEEKQIFIAIKSKIMALIINKE